MRRPNLADAPTAAIAACFHSNCPRRGIGNLRRSATFAITRTSLFFIALWFGFPSTGPAQADFFDTLEGRFATTNGPTIAVPDYVSVPQPIPIRRILPADIVQKSIQLWRFSTNKFGVRWTYTETGANKMLAFREAHEGQKVRTAIGGFESPPGEWMFHPMPPTFTNYTQWKEGWLKNRTDKFFTKSEDDAKKMVAGLKNQ